MFSKFIFYYYYKNYFVCGVIVKVIFQAKMSNVTYFQLIICEDFSAFLWFYIIENWISLTVDQTKEDTWRQRLRIFHHFLIFYRPSDRTIQKLADDLIMKITAGCNFIDLYLPQHTNTEDIHNKFMGITSC